MEYQDVVSDANLSLRSRLTFTDGLYAGPQLIQTDVHVADTHVFVCDQQLAAVTAAAHALLLAMHATEPESHERTKLSAQTTVATPLLPEEALLGSQDARGDEDEPEVGRAAAVNLSARDADMQSSPRDEPSTSASWLPSWLWADSDQTQDDSDDNSDSDSSSNSNRGQAPLFGDDAGMFFLQNKCLHWIQNPEKHLV